MSEFGTYPYHDEPDEALKKLRGGFEAEGNAVTTHPATAALARAIVRHSEAGMPLTELLGIAAFLRPHSELPERMNVIRSSVMHYSDETGLPPPHDDESADELLGLLTATRYFAQAGTANDAEVELDEAFNNMLIEPLHTTMPSRYTLADLLLQLDPGRLPRDGAFVLDKACSVRLGLNAIALKQCHELLGGTFPFPHVDVRDPDGRQNEHLAHRFNSIIRNTPSRLRYGIGIDLLPEDQESLDKAKANLTLEERSSAKFMETFHALGEATPANIQYRKADLINKQEMERFKQSVGPESFDLILSLMFMYMLTEAERAMVLETSYELAKATGRILMIDSFDITGKGLTDISINGKRWRDEETMPWTAAVYDKKYPELGWQEIARSDTSRFLKIKLGTGKIAVGNSLVTLGEAIANHQP